MVFRMLKIKKIKIKIKKVMTLHVGKYIKQLALSYIDGGSVNCLSTLESQLLVFPNVGYIITLEPAILLLGVYTRKMERNMYTKRLVQKCLQQLYL